PDEVLAAIDGLQGVVIANRNSPRQTVVSGTSDGVLAATERLTARGIAARSFPVAAAFHSPVVAGADAHFAEALRDFPIAAPRAVVYANRTASPYPARADAVADGLAAHLVSPVLFQEQVEAMWRDGARVFVEVGPGRVITGLVEQILDGRPHLALSMDDPRGGGALQGLVRLRSEE